MNNRIAIFRRLIAKYWQPFALLGSAFTAILNILKLVQDAGIEIPIEKLPIAGRVIGTSKEDVVLRVIIFVALFILIRFPGVAIFITRIILGKPEVPPSLPRLFRGLRAYDEEDFGKLPGRQKEIDDCSFDIRSNSFYILEGESGCGKTSILNAALMPVAAKKFKIVKCRVADDPFGKILAALQNKAYGRIHKLADKKAILDTMAAVNKTLQDSSDQAKPLLVCIDQFEELFVTVPDKVRVRFIETLKEGIASGGMRLVIAIRSDFRDLLDKACREIDPQQTVLDLSKYYILKSFKRERAQHVVNEILKPVYGDDPVLQQEIGTFANALVDELLRPPRDTRLNPNDEKTVLPVELQMIGFMLESSGGQNFSAKRLRKMGGKIGLLREYIENAKNYVWHTTGVAGKDSLLILRYLISPAQTKWAQSPRAICKALNMPEAQVESVLQSFVEKYLVNRLPAVSFKDETREETDGCVYELMHEHLIRILIEAPDPVLQKAKDAKERLRFWMERTASTFTETDKVGLFKKAVGFFKMPIPLVETFKLWRFANQLDERRMLKLNLRSFLLRLLLPVLPLTAWTFWTYTDIYQINSIIADAPVAKTAAGLDSSVIKDYLKTLIKLGQTEQALAAAREISDASSRSWALRQIATDLAKAGQTEQALAAAREISEAYSRSWALSQIATELAKAKETNFARKCLREAIAATEDIDNVDKLSQSLASIASGFAQLQSFRKARHVANQCTVPKDKLSAYIIILQEYYKMKHSVQKKEETAPVDSSK